MIATHPYSSNSKKCFNENVGQECTFCVYNGRSEIFRIAVTGSLGETTLKKALMNNTS